MAGRKGLGFWQRNHQNSRAPVNSLCKRRSCPPPGLFPRLRATTLQRQPQTKVLSEQPMLSTVSGHLAASVEHPFSPSLGSLHKKKKMGYIHKNIRSGNQINTRRPPPMLTSPTAWKEIESQLRFLEF